MNSLKNAKCVMGALLAASLVTGCLGTEEEAPAPVDSGLVNLAGQLGGGAQQKISQKVGALALSDYLVYCLSFANPPYAATAVVNADGTFSIPIPSGVPVGCFVNVAGSNEPVATLVVVGDATGYGGDTSSTLALNSSVNLGQLALDLETGTVEVPKTTIAAATVPAQAAFNVESLHDASYQLSCATTGNASADQACKDQLLEGGAESTVFFRIMKAEKAGETLFGIGVWKSQAAFDGCGSIDMLNSEKSALQLEEGISFLVDGLASGAAFVNDQELCLTRDGQAPTSMQDPRNYYAAGPLVASGNGYTMYHEWSDQQGDCARHAKTAVSFFSDDGVNMTGNFTQVLTHDELTPGACAGLETNQSSFVVNFTKVQ